MFFRPKHATKEYTQSMLPQTRRQVYFDVFKMQFLKLFVCGLILLVFALPLHLTAIMKDLSETAIYAGYNAGEITAESAYSSIQSMRVITSAVEIIGYVILAIGFAGVARIIKKLAWEENVYVGSDLIKGIKQNIGQYILLALLLGAIVFVCKYAFYRSPSDAGNVNFWLGLIPTVLCALVLAPIAAYMSVTIAVYGIGFVKNIKYAILLYKNNFFKTLLACIVCFIPYVVQLIPNFYCHLFGRIVSSVMIPFVMLGWFLFAYNSLDKTINKEYYPELIKKGLYLPETEISDSVEENK